MAEQRAISFAGMGSLGKIPGGRQIALLVALSMSIAIGITAAFWLREPSYELLYSNLSSRDTSEIVDVLRADKTAYRLDNGSLMVPSDEVYAARMRLSSQGLPRGAGFGLEIIEGESSFSTSQFMENARYHHALETELARTISNLQPVQTARVHLAIPKPTVFLRDKNKPGASVLLDLYPGRNLEDSQVSAIVHLVASSIPDMESSQVTVVDQRGRLLNAPGDSAAAMLTSREFEYVERLQETYANRIVNLLTPMMGPGRIQATVNAAVDFTQREQTREEFDPESRVIRSEQLSQDMQRDGSLAARGVPGALSNQPPLPSGGQAAVGPERPLAASDANAMRESVQSTRNFELDRTLSTTREPGSVLRRLSVAVLVDHVQDVDANGSEIRRPLEPEELAEIESLVRDAVGFDAERGDSISITNRSFYEGPELQPAEGPGFFAQPLVRDILRQLPGAALLLVIGLGVIRPIVMALGKQGSAAMVSGPRPGVAGAPTPQASPPPALSYDDKVSVAKNLASKDPERVAQVVRAWVQDGSR